MKNSSVILNSDSAYIQIYPLYTQIYVYRNRCKVECKCFTLS